jgi:hypothetical protein
VCRAPILGTATPTVGPSVSRVIRVRERPKPKGPPSLRRPLHRAARRVFIRKKKKKKKKRKKKKKEKKEKIKRKSKKKKKKEKEIKRKNGTHGERRG